MSSLCQRQTLVVHCLSISATVEDASQGVPGSTSSVPTAIDTSPASREHVLFLAVTGALSPHLPAKGALFCGLRQPLVQPGLSSIRLAKALWQMPATVTLCEVARPL